MKPPSPESVSALVDQDPYLEPYRPILQRRSRAFLEKERVLTGGKMTLADFASGHEYFGLHFRNGEWVFREWAPNAKRICIIGSMTGWSEDEAFALERTGDGGNWEARLPESKLSHADLYRLRIYWEGGGGDRIPAYARRVVQDPDSLIFNAQVWSPGDYPWQVKRFKRSQAAPYVYEAHVGMAQEAESIGTYKEFTDNIIPRIAASGYTVIQLMAVQEHPYYASFGYQVSNFYAASSRFGTPDDLKELIDCAHESGLAVIMDLIHSHAVMNETEGLSRFDGTLHQYFHEGSRGFHPAWQSRCFDYAKPQVLHFLLSNCRFWLDEYRFDGFRFDGVTSMLYHHRGMGSGFHSYDDYFGESVDEGAIVYLTLANRLIHSIRPDALTIAEDVSGMPGLASPISEGGSGFDCRFAMGIPDYWIRLTKDTPDEAWPMGALWHELTNRRRDEKTISYAESHDQALVGDQTIIFRLIGKDIYDHMTLPDRDLKVDRGIALHKMIRLITLATAGGGYLNFMGNEFGHPEWIDFPREGNGWSYRYARRQWHLSDDTGLKYHCLGQFDRHMVALAKANRILDTPEIDLLVESDVDKAIIFTRADLLFAFNFHPGKSHVDYRFDAPPGKYAMVLDTDRAAFGGHARLKPDQEHFTLHEANVLPSRGLLSLYLPARTALVLKYTG